MDEDGIALRVHDWSNSVVLGRRGSKKPIFSLLKTENRYQ